VSAGIFQEVACVSFRKNPPFEAQGKPFEAQGKQGYEDFALRYGMAFTFAWLRTRDMCGDVRGRQRQCRRLAAHLSR
jgi:hypothetical protein